MSTPIATEGMTSINSISELSNTTLFMISGSTITTSIETSNFDVNTQNNEIQTNTFIIISHSVSTYQSVFVTTTATDISESFEIPIQTITETFTMTGYTISSYNKIISSSTFETSIVFPQTVSETSISLSVDTLSDSLINTLLVSSGSLIATDSSEFSILSMTISPSHVGNSNIPSLSSFFSVQSLTSDTTDSAFKITNVSRVSNVSLTTDTVITPITTAIVENTVLNSKKTEIWMLSISEEKSRSQQIETNQISYSSKIEEPSFSSYQDLSSIQLSSSIIHTMDHFIYTTNTLITSYLDDTSFFQSSSLDNAASVSTSFPYFIQPTYHHSSMQTTEYYATIHAEFTSYVTTSFYESNTDTAATGIYYKEIVTAGKPYMHTSVMPSQTQLASMNNLQDLTIDFRSTYFEPYFKSNNDSFSSAISKYLLSTLQSTSLLLSFNTRTNVSGVTSYMETTSMMTFESSIQTKDLTILSSPPIQITAVSIDFKPTLLKTAINFNSKTMSSMIKPSSQQTNSDNTYNEIDTSSKDLSFLINSFSESVTSREQLMTTLSYDVIEPISTLSTSTIQSGLSEKNKTIIFVSTTSAVVTIIVVISLMIFAKVYMSKYNLKPPAEDDNISWSNHSSPPKAAFTDYSVTGKRIYPLLNTSSTSFKMHPYEHNWNDIV